jgi:hypothetical protein
MEKRSNGGEKLQIIYRWKALGAENTLEQFIFGLVCYNSLASKGKGFRHIIQSDDLACNWTNWRFREAQVGPTILLKSLLAQNHHSLHDFLDGVGVQNQGTAKGANSLSV